MTGSQEGSTNGDATLDRERGLGRHGWLAAVLVGVFVPPAVVHSQLVAGGRLSQWIVLVLAVAVARAFRTRLSRHDMILIVSVVGVAVPLAASGVVDGLLAMQYFVRSPAATGAELAELIPAWAAPPLSSESYVLRALLHRDWWAPISVVLVGLIWSRLSLYVLGYVFFRITSDLERLPFPMAPVAAEGVTALAESEKRPRHWECLLIGAFCGVGFCLLWTGLPAVTHVVFGKPVSLIPPLIDCTRACQRILPGAALTISTNLAHVFTGFVLPFWFVVGAFLSSAIGQLGLNPLLGSAGVLPHWKPGMGARATQMTSHLSFWLSFRTGLMLAVALIGVAATIRAVLKKRGAQGSLGQSVPARQKRGDVSVVACLVVYVAAALAVMLVCRRLAPKLSSWIILAFGFGYTPIVSYASARLLGIGGYGCDVPNLTDACRTFTGYRGIDIWFAPLPAADAGPTTQRFRELALTGMPLLRGFKAAGICIPLTTLSAILFSALLWRAGDIPSQAYPHASKLWCWRAYQRHFWLTASRKGGSWYFDALKPTLVLSGTAYGLASCALLAVLKMPTTFAYGTIVGLGGEFSSWPGILIGALLGRFVLKKYFGAETWVTYAPTLLAGFMVGLGCTLYTVLAATRVILVPLCGR